MQDQAAILVNGHTYVRVGDALRIPDFHLGNGVSFGLEEAQALVQALHTKPKSEAIDEFSTFFRESSEKAMHDTEWERRIVEQEWVSYQKIALSDSR